MKIKKVLAIGICLILTVGVFSACGGDSQVINETPQIENTVNQEVDNVESEVPEETEPADADIYAGLKFYESQSGMSLYMSDGYTEGVLEGVACYFAAQDSALSCTTESFEVFESAGLSSDMSLEEYAQLVIDANGLTGDVLTDEYGNVYIIYSQNIDGSDITYYAFFGRGSDAYWTCNFMCETSQTASHEANFKLWASSIQLP